MRLFKSFTNIVWNNKYFQEHYYNAAGNCGIIKNKLQKLRYKLKQSRRRCGKRSVPILPKRRRPERRPDRDSPTETLSSEEEGSDDGHLNEEDDEKDTEYKRKVRLNERKVVKLYTMLMLAFFLVDTNRLKNFKTSHRQTATKLK